MKRRLLPLCTALVLCLLLAPAAWAAVYPYPPIETLHIGSHDGTEIQKDTYYLVRGETVTTQDANADNYNIYYKDGTLTLRAAALPDYLLVPGETTIHLVGENTIGTKDAPTDVGIQGVTPGAITITGPGSCSIHSSAEGIITVQPDSATDPQVTSDIRLQGGTINTNGSSISTRYGGICITGSAQVMAGSLSTGGDPNTEEAQRARDLVISGRASVTAERLSALQQIQITGSATVTVENPAGIAINGNRGIAISEQARVTAIGTTGGLNAFSGPITIDSTGKTIAQATDTTRNYAAISMGQGDSALSLLTICGETAVSGAVGIGSSQGSILIDASALEITATYAGIINSTSSSETKITVQNSAQVSITCSGPKGISASSGTVEIADSTVTVQAASSAYTALPTLTYTDSYQVTAGTEAGSAGKVDRDDLTASVFQNPYVQVTPVTTIPVEQVILDQSTLSLTTGGTAALQASVLPADATEPRVTWTSSDQTVAVVDQAGLVTAVGPGTATITARAGEASAACTVTVSRPASSGPTRYPPIQTEPIHGALSVSPTRPKRGDTVTITPVPDQGYQVEQVTVTQRDGTALPVTDHGNGTYTFSQPSGRVTITVTFSPLPCDGGDTCPARVFSDLDPTQWYHEAIDYVLTHQLMAGVSQDRFAPQAVTTRAQAVTLLWRLEGCPAADTGLSYADVADTAWYREAVGWANAAGIAQGTSPTTFSPDTAVSREQMAVFFLRYAQYKGYDTTQTTDLSGYQDASQISGYARDAVAWAAEAGLLTGVSQDTLLPLGTATRAQTAAVLMRFCTNPAH